MGMDVTVMFSTIWGLGVHCIQGFLSPFSFQFASSVQTRTHKTQRWVSYGLDTPPFDKGVFTHHAISSSINLFHPASPSAIHVPFAPSLYPYLLGERSVLMFTSLYVYWPPTECALGR